MARVDPWRVRLASRLATPFRIDNCDALQHDLSSILHGTRPDSKC